jgi:hypothetical protein
MQLFNCARHVIIMDEHAADSCACKGGQTARRSVFAALFRLVIWFVEKNKKNQKVVQRCLAKRPVG